MKTITRNLFLGLFIGCLACNMNSTKSKEPFALQQLDANSLQSLYGWTIEYRTIGVYGVEQFFDDCGAVRVSISDVNQTSGYWDISNNEEINKASYQIEKIESSKGQHVDSAIITKAINKVELFRKMRLSALEYVCETGWLIVWKDSSQYLYIPCDKMSSSTRLPSVLVEIDHCLFKFQNPTPPN